MSTFRLYIYHLISLFLPESRCHGLKIALLRWAGAKIGTNVRIYSSVRILGSGSFIVGDDVHIGTGCYIAPVAPAVINIGSHVDIAPMVTILTGSHEINPDGDHVGGKGTVASVAIGNGSWIGAKAIILPGIALPEKTIVAAGSVVTRAPSEKKTLIAGVPARVKRTY